MPEPPVPEPNKGSAQVPSREPLAAEGARAAGGMLPGTSRIDAAKIRFYENASHELRTPLTVLGLAVEVLRPYVGLAAAPHLATVSRTLERLNELVDALLLFVRSDTYSPPPEVEELDLAEATSAVLAMFPTVVAEAGLTLTTSIDCRRQRAGGPRGLEPHRREPRVERREVHGDRRGHRSPERHTDRCAPRGHRHRRGDFRRRAGRRLRALSPGRRCARPGQPRSRGGTLARRRPGACPFRNRERAQPPGRGQHPERK